MGSAVEPARPQCGRGIRGPGEDTPQSRWLTREVTGPETWARVPLPVLASQLLDRVDAAVLVVDLEGVVRYASPFCEELYGWRPAEMLGRDSGLFALTPVTVELRHEIAAALRDGRSWEGDFTVRRRDGSFVDVHAIDSPVLDQNEAMTGVISLAFDATEDRRQRRQLVQLGALVQILRDVGETLIKGLDAQQVMRTVVGAARRLTGAPIAAYLERVEEGVARYEVRLLSGRSEGDTSDAALSDDAYVLRRSMKSAQPTRFDDLAVEGQDPGALDLVLRPKVGPLRSGLVAPVRNRDGDAIGAIIVAHDEPSWFGDDDERIVGDIAAHAGIVLDIAVQFRTAEVEIAARTRAEEEQRFLGEISSLLSWSLDYPDVYEKLARLCVPFLGDLCLIDVAEGGDIHRVASVHADPARADLVEILASRYPPDPLGMHPAAIVAKGGLAQMSSELSDEFLRATTRDDEHYRLVKALGFMSYMSVPLVARGRVLGALTLVSSGSDRIFTNRDLELAEEVGRRAALAIDNARLYAERDYVARTLQSSLLPPSLPAFPGVEFTARYRAAGEGSELGGDFYDVFQLPDGRVIALIGDVMGKGIAAAGLTETVRSAVRALAMVSPRPDLVLEQTNRLLVAERHTQFVTALLVLLDPKTGEGLLASAGHPPALRASRGVVGSIEVPYGTPLGAFADRPYATAAFSLSPGEVLILYTDGLSEARRKGVLLGEDGLRELVRELEPRPRVIVEGLRQGALAYAGVLRDDLQILAIARPMPQHQPYDGNDRSEPSISEHH